MSSSSLSRRDVLRAATAASAALGFGPLAMAQGRWPAKPVNMVVPFAAGGGTDAFGRPLSAQFAKNTGQNLVIENRGGAGGTLGAAIACPGRPVVAVTQARPRISGMRFTSSISTAHFAIVPNTAA